VKKTGFVAMAIVLLATAVVGWDWVAPGPVAAAVEVAERGPVEPSTAAPPPEPVGFEPQVLRVPKASSPAADVPAVPPVARVTAVPVEEAPVVEPVPVVDMSVPSGRNVAGFDLATSVEVVAERDVFETVYANVDGTSTVQYSSMPVNYLDGAGVWQKVDNRVRAGRDGVLVTAGNSWSASFEPMTAGRGVAISTAGGPVRFWAEGAAAVAPTVEPNGTSVRYRDVIPGADLVYQVTGAGVEELLILKTPSATSQVSFAVDGAEFDTEPAGLSAQNGRVRISRPESFTGAGRVIDPAKHVFTVTNRRGAVPGTARITLGLDAAWVKARPVGEFPITIDPSVVVNTGATTLRAYANYTNNGVAYATYEDGYARIGNPYFSSTSTVRWRSVVSFPHGSYLWANVLDASLITTESGTAGSGTQGLNVYWADQWGFHYGATPRYYETNAVTSNQLYGWLPYVSSSISTGTASHSGNLKYLYNGWTRRGHGTGALLLTGNEGSAYTLKKFTVTLSMTVNRWPNTFTGSASGAYLVPTLTRPTVTDPDNDALTFRYTVYNTNGTAFANSGWITGSSWIAPKVPSTWHNETHNVKIEAYDGISFNGETHIREWNGTWKATDRAPNAAGLTSPANGASTHDLTPTLSANTATDPDGDTVQYRFFTCTTSPCGTKTYQPNSTWRTSTPWTATPTSNIGTYGTTRWWGVETFDGELVTSSSLRSLNLVNTPASAATLTSPADGAEPHSLSHTFTANTATDPDGDGVQYRFFYCTDGPCTARTYMTSWSTTTPWTKAFTFPAAMWGTTIKWGVETTDAYQTLPTTSALRTLTLANSAPVITNLSPPANTIISGTQPVFGASLSDPDGDAINYRFVVTPTSGVGIVAASPWAQLATPGPVPEWTLPAELVTDVSYRWRIETTDEFGAAAQSTNRAISAQGRLGAGSVSPVEQVGPVTVNLASGNVFYTTGLGRSIESVGGPISAGLTYNSNDRSSLGLTGTYYIDANSDDVPQESEIVLSRTDRLPVFDWGASSPAASVPADQFKVRWTGFLRVPNQPGDWLFAGGHDDRVTIKINNQVAYTHTSPVALDAVDGFTGAVPLSGLAGQLLPVQIDYTESTGPAHVGFRVKNNGIEYQVEQSWFTTDQPVLPACWKLTVDTGLDPVWQRAVIGDNDITLVSVDGEEIVFERDPDSDSYVTPDEVDDMVAVNDDGTVTVHGGDSNLYRFTNTGYLADVTTAADTLKAAGARSVYTGVSPNLVLSRLEDRVDTSRNIQFHYQRPGDTCPTPPAGFDPTPAGMLCQIDYPDDTHTRLYYLANQLARISDPGDEGPNPAPEGRSVTDLVWAAGRLTRIVEPADNDIITAQTAGHIPVAQHVPVADLGVEIGWNSTGDRPTTIASTRPAVGAPRPTTGFGWAPVTKTATVTRTGIGGTARTVTYDATGRILTDTDAVGRVATTVWASADDDFVVATTSGGRVTTTVHDADWHPVDVYGPAPSSACFNTTVRTPTGACTATTPHTHTDYDHNLTGLTGTHWNTPDRSGAPAGTSAAPAGDINYTWPGTTAPTGVGVGDNWSARFTGIITIPTTTTYTFTVGTGADDTAVLYLDDQPITGPVTIVGGDPVRVRIDFDAGVGTSNLTVSWTQTGGTATTVPAAVLKPGFWYATRTVIADAGGAAPPIVTETRYTASGVDASLGLVVAEIDDPDGLALTTSFGYEPAAPGSLLRRVRRTLPAFVANPTTTNSTTYEHYAPTAQLDNPCTPANDPVSQAGLLRYTQLPTPDSGTPIRTEVVYDNLGRTVASRYTTESAWTCTTRDARGRTTTVTHPADVFHPAGRTVTHNHAIAGDPRHSTIADTAGTITTRTDTAGRVTSTTDAWGTTTNTTYDTAGRAATTTNPAGTITNTYDNANRLTSQQLDGATLATITYSPDGDTLDPGQLTSVEFPATGAGNGTIGTFSYDTLGQVSGVEWHRAADGALITADAVTRSLTGRMLTATADAAGSPTWTYSYDSVQRLIRGQGSGHDYQYSYDAIGGCGSSVAAGANTNRTAMSDNGIAVAAYCYDPADRLTSTTQPGLAGTIGYDTRGNTDVLGGNVYGYDHSNRHLSTEVAGLRRVTYTRDVLDRIVARTDTDLATGTSSTLRYSYGDSADAADVTFDTTGTIIEANFTMPGGVLYTKQATGGVWSYPNVHGDIAATTDHTGTKQGATRVYDPYGNPLSTVPDNQAGSFDYGWVGQHQRPLEHAAGLQPVIEMGARIYHPALGRFLQTDPIEGGTTTNGYAYVPDPTNQYDLNGQWCITGKNPNGSCRSISRGAGRAVRGVRDRVSAEACVVWCVGARFNGWRPQIFSACCGYGGGVGFGNVPQRRNRINCTASAFGIEFGYSWIKNNLRSVRYVGGVSLGFPKFGGRCGPGRL
jgi:RHS repeat-associated protein